MKNLSRRKFMAGTAALTAGALAMGARFPLAAATPPPAISFEEYRSHDALSLARLVREEVVTPAELLELAIRRTEQINPIINAVVLKHYALARKTVSNGVPAGPFAGVPFLLKDLGVGLAGTVTTDGSRFFHDAQADQDDAYVHRAKQAGLVIFGKTLSPEFGNNPSSEGQLFGATHNPWGLAHSAGGSSGGSAAAVAAGIVPVAHASDGGGSIRIPASACGIFGLKPSRGLMPIGKKGKTPRGGLSVQHVVSRSVRDSAAMLDALAFEDLPPALQVQADQGSYLEQLAREPGRLRIALMRKPLLPIPVDSACQQAVQRAAAICRALGHEVVEASPNIDMKTVQHAAGIMAVTNLAERIAAREAELGRKVRATELENVNVRMLDWGRSVTAQQHDNALDTITRVERQMAAFMKDHDLILSPVMTMTPPRLGVLSMSLPLDAFSQVATRGAIFTTLYNVSGQPAMSVPLHWTEADLPVGVMFAARMGEERTLIRLAAQLERAHPWFHRVPWKLG